VSTTTAAAARATAARPEAAAGAFTDDHAAEHDRLGLLIGRRGKARDHFLGNLVLDEPFNVAQEAVLVDANQRHRLAL
jgi:hypothetical protein